MSGTLKSDTVIIICVWFNLIFSTFVKSKPHAFSNIPVGCITEAPMCGEIRWVWNRASADTYWTTNESLQCCFEDDCRWLSVMGKCWIYVFGANFVLLLFAIGSASSSGRLLDLRSSLCCVSSCHPLRSLSDYKGCVCACVWERETEVEDSHCAATPDQVAV